MAEFQTQPYVPMDRQYHAPTEAGPSNAYASIEEPIIPIYELGTTVPERDPAGRFKNMIQGVQAAIRRGAGRIQLIMMTPHNSAIGGRPKAYGPEVREQLREVFKANEAILTGVEMPTSSLNNLSGFDPQRRQISDEVRQNNLDEVRDAIKFVADVAQGGGVDLVAFEFTRPVFDAPWNKDKQGNPVFEQSEERIVSTVDTRTGRISQYGVDEIEKRPIALDKKTGNRFTWDPNYGDAGEWVIKDDDGNVIEHTKDIQPWSWEDYEAHAKRKSEQLHKEVTPEEVFMEELHETNKMQAEGMVAYHEGIIEDIANTISSLEERKKAGYMKDPQTGEKKILEADDIQKIETHVARLKRRQHSEQRNIDSYKIQAAETQKMIESTKPLRTFAKHKSMEGYAMAGIMAMQENHNNPNARLPLYVGPEIGWPEYYGGHPDEFRELIKGARQKMIQFLTQEKVFDESTKTWVESNYYDPSLSPEEAQEEAKKHIKGCLDTSHVGMWLKNFKPELPWDKRVKEFNKWYLEQMEAIAKDEELVGSIQLVNSMSSAHGHLPADQGIFPVVEAAKIFKRNKFSGFMVSEGHEEESFEEGRILTQTWRAFNPQFGGAYRPGAGPRSYRDAEMGYVGRTYSPRMMFGSYTPPFGEYKPWSEIPFE